MAKQLLKKVSIRTVFGDRAEVLETVLKDKTKPHALMRVVGFAVGTKEGEKDHGDGEKRAWKGLVGRFEATNAQTGEVFYSPVCFLPEFAIDLVCGQMTGAEGEKVAFAFDIGAEYSKEAATSYEYTITPLTEQTDDELAALSFTAEKARPLALAAPAKAAKDKTA